MWGWRADIRYEVEDRRDKRKVYWSATGNEHTWKTKFSSVVLIKAALRRDWLDGPFSLFLISELALTLSQRDKMISILNIISHLWKQHAIPHCNSFSTSYSRTWNREVIVIYLNYYFSDFQYYLLWSTPIFLFVGFH